MKRTKFIQALGLGFISAPFAALPFRSKEQPDGACTATEADTPGPFTTHNPDSLVRADIRGDRDGISLDIELTILDRNNGCKPLEGAHVDIWHCDKDGLYSEYGNHRLQKEDLRQEHFLRGRQVTDKNGKVAFTSIFPGWYPGRSTHIHFEVQSPSGDTILISQLAFPEGPQSAVNQVNASKGYKGMEGYRTNDKDGEFKDGVETQLVHISGNLNSGFALTHSIIV